MKKDDKEFLNELKQIEFWDESWYSVYEDLMYKRFDEEKYKKNKENKELYKEK